MTSDLPEKWAAGRGPRGDAYEAVFEAQAAAGKDIHGEARFVRETGARRVLDAGCGTGRVARELARHGLSVVGIDVDPVMLATAQRKAPALDWRLGDLATVALGQTFDTIVMAGNVLLFVETGTEAMVVANLARHLDLGGRLIAGFQLRPGGLSLETYDRLAQEAGLALEVRYATWDRQAWTENADYAVSVHRRVK